MRRLLLPWWLVALEACGAGVVAPGDPPGPAALDAQPPAASSPRPAPSQAGSRASSPPASVLLSSLLSRDPRGDGRCTTPFVEYWTWQAVGTGADSKVLEPLLWLAPVEAPSTPVVSAGHPRADRARCIAVGPHRGLNLANWCCRAGASAQTVLPPLDAKGLVATLAVERSVVSHQRELVVAVAIENRGPQPAELLRTVLSSAVLLLEVRDGVGKVMPPTPPPTPPAVPDPIRLPRGGGQTVQLALDVFGPPLPAGAYTVRVKGGEIGSGVLKVRIEAARP